MHVDERDVAHCVADFLWKVISGPRLCLLVVPDWILGARWNRDTIWRQLDDEAGPGRIWASHRA
ncbi:hypothetical protein Ac2012v2_003050, partial [Leucoagaricus gongylophorus]